MGGRVVNAAAEEVTGTINERLAALTVIYTDAKEAFEAARDRWQELIVDAVDAGAKPQVVADLVGVSEQRIRAIIARIYGRN